MPSESPPTNAITSAALEAMTPELLIKIILRQQQAIAELRLEIDRLKGQRDTNSTTTSQPPSTDFTFAITSAHQVHHQVARWVARPIEIVEYVQQQCLCGCGELVS